MKLKTSAAIQNIDARSRHGSLADVGLMQVSKSGNAVPLDQFGTLIQSSDGLSQDYRSRNIAPERPVVLQELHVCLHLNGR